MHGTIIACLLTVGSFGCSIAFDLRSGVSSQEKLSPENKNIANDEVARTDLYKVAVLLSVVATIFS